MSKHLCAIALAACSVLLLLFWVTGPAQQMKSPPNPHPPPAQSTWLRAMPSPAPACTPSGWMKRPFNA